MTSDRFLNILIRTCDRPNSFKRCLASIDRQTYPLVRPIVGMDSACKDSSYFEADIRLERESESIWEHNRFMNQLHALVEGGWVMYLDDDDEFAHPNAAELIMAEAKDLKEVIFWRVDIDGTIIPRDGTFPFDEIGGPSRGNISGIGFAFHHSLIPSVKWEAVGCADYFAISELMLWADVRQRWIDAVLTKTQGKPGLGLREDQDTVAARR